MEIELLNELPGNIRPPAVLVDAIEDVARRLHWERGDYWSIAMWGDGRNARSDAEADVFEPAQLVHHSVYVLGVSDLRVENGFGIVEDDEHLLGG